MDGYGVPAAAWSVLAGLQREPWFLPAVLALAALFLVLCLILMVRVRHLKRRLADSNAPSRMLFHAVTATREARAKAGSAQDPPTGGRRRRTSAHAGQPVQPAGPATPTVPQNAETCHVKIYIDYSNLVLNWKRTDANGVDWDQLPPVILRSLQRLPVCAGKRIVYCGANVYGSYYPGRYYDLLETIENGTARSITVPFQAYKRQRMREAAGKAVPATHPDRGADRAAEVERIVRARLQGELADWRRENAAETELLSRGLPNKFGYLSFPFERRTPQQLRTAHYTSDGVPIAHEKGLDVRCCTDLMADGAFDIFDVAVLVTNDSDFVPAVSFVKDELGKSVIQLGPRAISDVIRAASSGHIDLEDVIAQVNANRGIAPKTAPAPARTPAAPVAQPASAIPPEPVPAAATPPPQSRATPST